MQSVAQAVAHQLSAANGLSAGKRLISSATAFSNAGSHPGWWCRYAPTLKEHLLTGTCPHVRQYHPPDRLKVWKPTSPGQRHRITVDRYNLWNGKPFKPLVEGLSKAGGRSNTGRITVWHQGGGHKRLYRLVDFHRDDKCESIVKRIEYDPNRSARIALVEQIRPRNTARSPPPEYEARNHRYILAPSGIGAGDVISSRADAPIKSGMTKVLRDLPTGSTIHNIELRPGAGGSICRAAGTSATLVKNGDDGMTLLMLPSGEQRYVSSQCCATVGSVGNAQHFNRNLGKAGISRHLGIRPTTRAIATNPYDHPLGGKAKKNRKTPWGKVFMGVKTRKVGKPSSNMIYLSRHAVKVQAKR
eukprot:jgi/Ulvmu1/3050/UM015_0090.1